MKASVPSASVFTVMRRLLLYFSLSVVLLLAAGVSLVYFYQDKIIQLFIQEANKSIKTEIQIGKISLSLFEKFPQLAIKLDNIRITGTVKEDKRPMAVAQQLYATLDLRDLLISQYVIRRVYLENAEVLLYVDAQGNENFDILRRSEPQPGQPKEEVSFALKRILLNKVNVRYERQSNQGEVYEVFANDAAARFSTKNGVIDIALEGNLTTRQILVDNLTYFKNKQITLKSQLHYQQGSHELFINPSVLSINQAHFAIEGKWQGRKSVVSDIPSGQGVAKGNRKPQTVSVIHGNDQIDLAIQSTQTDIQTLLSLLPEATARELRSYRSKGEVFFKGTVKGEVGNKVTPRVEVRFGCKDATFIHPESGKRIEHVQLTGAYDNGRQQNLTTSSLNLTNISGILDNRRFSGRFSLLNFRNPTLIFQAQGAAEVGSLLAFFPTDKVERARGEVALRVNFEGKISDLKAERLMQYVRTSGEITIRDLQFKLRGIDLPFNALNGNFQFQKSDLQVNGFSGRAGNSDFQLNGYFRNIMAYLLLKGQDLGMDAEFRSQFLDFDELLTTQSTQTKSAEPYRFQLSPRLSLNLNCIVDAMRFRRFKARNMQGHLTVHDQVARINDLVLQTAGGNVALQATLNGQQNNRLILETQASLDRIKVDSTFHMFENFKQTFIQDRHLKGRLSSEVHAFLVFDDQLTMITPLIKADIQASVVDGELNNFAPMQKLSFFLRKRELANIRFSELKNSIHIENRTITIPSMEIQSTASNIAIFGTHTFDQVMDYHLKFPLSNLGRPDKDEKFGAVESDGRGSGNLFLALKGTSDNFKVSYDVKQVGKKIQEDLQSQKKQWKTIFKKKELPNKQSEEKEEYFDFHE